LSALLGFDLGGTKLSAALFSRDGDFIHKTEHFLEDRTGTEVGSLVVEQVLAMQEVATSRDLMVSSVGICVPGISNQADQTVWAPNIRGWEAYPLLKEVREALRDPALPVSIESDRSCYILGEMWKGNARDCKNAIFVAVGTGIGMGIVANGQIINGANGIAGAVGWMALDQPYTSEYDPCGQFEYYASGPGIARGAENLIRKGAISKYLQSGQISTKKVFDAYAKKDPVAEEVILRCIEYWGMAVANLVSIFNPEKIIFGGGVFGPAIPLLDKILEEAKKWAQPISMQKVIVEASSLKGDTGLYGAGFLALRNEKRQ
jgi:glucokinase